MIFNCKVSCRCVVQNKYCISLFLQAVTINSAPVDECVDHKKYVNLIGAASWQPIFLNCKSTWLNFIHSFCYFKNHILIVAFAYTIRQWRSTVKKLTRTVSTKAPCTTILLLLALWGCEFLYVAFESLI